MGKKREVLHMCFELYCDLFAPSANNNYLRKILIKAESTPIEVIRLTQQSFALDIFPSDKLISSTPNLISYRTKLAS